MSMINHFPKLSKDHKKYLIAIARDAIQAVISNQQPKQLNLADTPKPLTLHGASFVTITINNQLRGCIGTLEASQPLALDVQEHAIAAATQDYRFPPLQKEEYPHIKIEVSVLSPMQKIEYKHPTDLAKMIRPGKDGVVLINGARRATFLPQVWEKIQSPEDFLAHLCLKMGASPDLWREKVLDARVYQVEVIEEDEFRE